MKNKNEDHSSKKMNKSNKHNWRDFFKHYAKYRKNQKLMTLEENIALIKTYQAGGKDSEKALNKLTNQYLAFVANITKEYTHLAENWSDLFQEGCLAMIKSYKTYDSTKGHPGTYAEKSIIHAIIMHLKVLQTGMERSHEKIEFKKEDDLIQTEEDIYQQYFRREELEKVLNKEIKDKLVDGLTFYSERDYSILTSYFGLTRHKELFDWNTNQIRDEYIREEPKTVSEIAEIEELTKSAIYLIKKRSIEKLKKSKKIKKLKEYL